MGFFDKIKEKFQSSNTTTTSTKLNILQRFEMLRGTASGTMSKFHVVKEHSTGKIYGLKILDPEKKKQFDDRFPGIKKPSEGEIAVQFENPLVVKTYEYGYTTDRAPYLLMEYIEGQGLQMLIHDEDSNLEQNRHLYLAQMAKSLQYVHQKGFIHRDVCPRNFICSTDYKTVKLIDFGLTVPAQPPFMQPGNRTGTPLYMAPEIVRRRETDKRVDIFAFGVTAYHICTYKLPWATKDTSGMAALSHDTVKPTPITEYCPTIAPELATLIHKCFSVDPDQRPNSFESVLTALRRIQQTAN